MCDAWIYDNGGANGNYANNCHGYLVIYPASEGGVVAITYGMYDTENYYDYVEIYNGVGTNGTPVTRLSGRDGALSEVIVSTHTTGALTILFHSDGSVRYSGFAFHVNCLEIITMSDSPITGCLLAFTDPGGSGNYSNNQDVTQTICSDNGERLHVSFSSFSLSSGDYLYVYDGNSTSSTQIGRYTGSALPNDITSSGDCITFRFTSNSSNVNSGWMATIQCQTCATTNAIPGSPCFNENINPFCTDEGQYTYYSGTSGSAHPFLGQSSGDYVGCLYSTPAPAWYYMRIQDPGDLTIYIEQHSLSTGEGIDVDFACWGPFTASSSNEFVENICCRYYEINVDYHPSNTDFNANYPYGNLIDCSFNARDFEYCHIPDAQTGQYYLLLITNYSEVAGIITFNSTSNSTATTDCAIMAAVSNTGPYCEGDTIQLLCNNPQAGATYSWTGPNDWTSSEVNPIIYPVTQDMDGYEYQLVKTYNGESSEPASTTINVVSLNTEISTNPSDTICVGDRVTLSGPCDLVSSVSVSGNCTNTWGPGGQHSGSIHVYPTENTTYTLQQTYGNCLGVDSVTIVVLDPSTQIIASDTEICRGDTVTLSAECPDESTSCSYQWRPGNHQTQTVEVTPTTSTSYILRQTIAGCVVRDTLRIIVNQPDVNTDTVFVNIARDSLPYMFLNQAYNEAGTYDIHLSNAHGCDSLITLSIRYLDTIYVNLDSVICPDQFPFEWNGVTFEEDGNAAAYLTAHNGADSVVQMNVRHYPSPISSLDLISEACAGDTIPVTIGVLEGSNLTISASAAVQGASQKIFIPDGISCAPYGTSYRSIANFNQFIPGAVMSDVNDILYVRLKIEHSALEDLKMSVVCPNGRRSKLIADYNNYTNSWGDVYNDYFRTNLGLANRLSDVVTCDSTQNPIGEPWNYIWSNNTNHNYQYAAGTHGYCYEAVNLQSYANPYWDFNSTWQYAYDSYTTHKSVKPSDPSNMTQIYHPYQSFSNLIGCPLNGQWYIEVQDLLEEDNGYLTEWELALSPSLLQIITPVVVSKQLVGPWVTNITDSTFIITPPIDLDRDTTVIYQFVLESDVGCTYDSTIAITFHPNKMRTLDTTICDSELPLTWEGQTFNSTEERIVRLQTDSGCDSVLIYRVEVNASSQYTDTVEICDTYTWQDGVTYTTSTDEPYMILTNANGCDSVVRLHLTIHNTIEVVDEVLECDSFMWIDGNMYYESTNEPVHVVEMETGCDSIVYLNLTLGHSAVSDTVVEACGSYSWYEYKNITNTCNDLTHTFTSPGGCDSIVTLHLTIFPLPEPCFNYYTLGDSYEVETLLHFEECTPGMVDYHWDMGNSVIFEGPAFDYAYEQAGTYRVLLSVTDENGCTAEKGRMVVIKNPEMQIYIPNSFTPNFDGENDVFKPTGLYITDEDYLLEIFNRWGEMVFRTTNPEEGWDGTFKGVRVPANSVMSYVLRCAYDRGVVYKKGVVTVIY